jgi:16S rRNA (guanine966-N2)-methyltransferase
MLCTITPVAERSLLSYTYGNNSIAKIQGWLMRVITGEYRGRRLASVKGANIRYTADSVKKSLFSILRDTVPGARFLDLYAGSGNVGIEAISRGAESVAFVDSNRACARTISANLELCAISPEPPRIMLLNMGMSRAMEYFRRHNIQFDLIFLDPPYRRGLVGKSLKEISDCGILSANGEIIAEHDVREDAPEQLGRLVMTRQKRYGTTVLSFYALAQ